MNERVVPKIINFCVVKLSNSPAITCVPRLELDHFESQLDSLRINQRFLAYSTPGKIIFNPANIAFAWRRQLV
jgi:hypothetical protein